MFYLGHAECLSVYGLKTLREKNLPYMFTFHIDWDMHTFPRYTWKLKEYG